jgi:hypothetical protein
MESCGPRQQHVVDILQTGTHHNEVRHVVVHSTAKPYNALQSRYNTSEPCMSTSLPYKAGTWMRDLDDVAVCVSWWGTWPLKVTHVLCECHQTHLLKQLRYNLLEALHNHRVGRLRALAAPDLLLGVQLRAIEVDAAATTTKRGRSCTSGMQAMALQAMLPMAGHCYLRCESGLHSLLAEEPSLLTLHAQSCVL